MSSGNPISRSEPNSRAISASQQRLANRATELQRQALRRFPFIADGSVEVIHDWLGGSFPRDTQPFQTADGCGYWPCCGDHCEVPRAGKS